MGKSPGRKLDLMPLDSSVLGFSNEWYPLAVESAVPYALRSGLTIRIPRAPVMLATKLAAFHNRGEGDLLGSHDMEDIITLVAGRPELAEELAAESADLRWWVNNELSKVVADQDFRYAVEGALPDAVEISGYYDVILDTFEDLMLPR